MTDSIQAYPLQWPVGRPRKPTGLQKQALFKVASRGWGKQSLTVAEGLKRLGAELERIGIEPHNVVVSTNLRTRLDGLPKSGQRKPDDPAVAVYFTIGDKPHCMPCDTYDRVADNLAAVAAHIEATRKIERHGVSTVAEMFTGFQALPAPGQSANLPWWTVLDVPQTALPDAVKSAFRTLARDAHPDHGGSDHQMAELNRAYQDYKQQRAT